MRKRPLIAGALAALLFAGTAHAQPRRIGTTRAYAPGISGLSVALASKCGVQNNGVSPSICMDFPNNSFSNTLTTDTGVKSGAGVTCTGTQKEVFTGAVPTGNYLVVVDATYPSSGGVAYSFLPSSSGNPQFYFSSSVTVTGGSNVTTARTGSVEIAAYWNGSAWTASFAGDTVVSIGTTAETTGSQAMSMCSYNGSYPLTTAFRSLRYYPGTFTAAQVQLAATQ